MTGAAHEPVDARALQLVAQALDLPDAGARESWLAVATSGDEALRDAARELLAACNRAAGDPAFMPGVAVEYADRVIRDVEQQERALREDATTAVCAALAGRYAYLRELGRGGEAVVFLAKDLKHEREVAIKVIRHELAGEAQRRRFLDEIRIAANLRHPYIVSLIDSGEAAAGVLYYVMPYIEGESLREKLDREGALPFDDALSILRDVAEALDHAHARGIVHRDIKPQNILLGSGHAMLADFGIAVARETTLGVRITEQGMVVGTPAYMSPEQAAGDRTVDARSDVYSLGCVAYEMLAGEVPFHGGTPQALIAKHTSAPAPDLAILRPWASAGVSQVVQAALAKDPADRQGGAGEFVRALAAARTSLGLEQGAERAERTEGAKHAPRADRVVGVSRRTGLAAVLLTVAVAAAVSLYRREAPLSESTIPSARDQRRIAVLYFDDLSQDPDIAVLARGLTEDVIDELAQVRGLTVVSPNGVRPFQGRAAPLDSVAAVLDVGTLVGGSVSSSPTSVRATVRMIDPATGRQLQSRSFEEPLAQPLALRDLVVTQVVSFLRERLGQEIRLREQRDETRSNVAWRAVQDGLELYRQGAAASREGREDDAIDLLRRADSLYAVAENADSRWLAPILGRGWTALALAHSRHDALLARSVLRSGERVSERMTVAVHLMLRAIAHSNRALRRQAGDATALALRGMTTQRLALLTDFGNPDSLYRAAEADLRAALDARPDDARSWYAVGELYFANGRFTEANDALAKAYEADAFLTEIRAVVNQAFHAALNSERFDDARRWCNLGRARFAGDPRFGTCALLLLGWTGRGGDDVAAAWRELASIERSDSVGMYASQWAYLRFLVGALIARSGMRDSALAVIAETRRGLAADSERTSGADVEAYARLLLGQRDDALRLLAGVVRSSPQNRGYILRSPWFKPLRGDSTFAALSRAESPR